MFVWLHISSLLNSTILVFCWFPHSGMCAYFRLGHDERYVNVCTCVLVGDVVSVVRVGGFTGMLTLFGLGFFGVPGPGGGGGGLQKFPLHKSKSIDAIDMKLGG